MYEVIVRRIGFTPEPHQVAVKVDRSSALGNPFRIGKDGDRDDVIRQHKSLWNNILTCPKDACGFNGKVWKLWSTLCKVAQEEDRQLVLLCWCHPLPCHADTYAEILNGTLKGGE